MEQTGQSKITELMRALGPGSRANKWKISLFFPQAIPVLENSKMVDLFCKSASFGARQIGEIDIHKAGKIGKLPGDPKYPNQFSIVFYNTEDLAMRRAFEQWMTCISDFQRNTHSGVPLDVMVDIQVHQLDSRNKPVVTMTYHHCFPTDISEISYSDDAQDQITETTVTITYTDRVTGNNWMDKPQQYDNPTRNSIS